MAQLDEPESGMARDEVRSVAQLDMLHSLAAALNMLGDIEEIGAAITAELRTIIDYHNCRVYLLQPDGVTLFPIAFRGELFTEYATETLADLVTTVGEGITGHVAETKTSLLTPDARDVSFSVTIAGTDDDLLESMLAVPMIAGDEVVGVIVLSKLGYSEFDVDDQRLLEVLASHAAVAFQTARLLEAERREARVSSSLLRLSQVLTAERAIGEIFQRAIETAPTIVDCIAAAAYTRDTETGSFRMARALGVGSHRIKPRAEIVDVPRQVAEAFLFSDTTPFVLPQEIAAQVPADMRFMDDHGAILVTPLRWEPDGFGAIVLVGTPDGPSFDDDDLSFAQGVASITSLALGNARRLSDLERFHELVETLDAIFWEADAKDLQLTFLGGRADAVLGADATEWPTQGRTWGEHIVADDRARAVAAARSSADEARDATLEYRVRTPGGEDVWMRDMIHVVRRSRGAKQLRGLMVDITERKTAEQALRASERQFSEAFLREREAAQRLRALDEMKNTFLEAVSHDLRTPLTSILGSAITLERAGMQLRPEDAADLLHRIATNARKLERLLGDLLDLDRLQRGIVTPQRRPTDITELIRRSVEETDRSGHEIHVLIEPFEVSLDAPKVERIIENLLTNAIRHTPPDAQVWVRAEPLDGGLLLTVEDDGAGIPDELREEVFEPFRQAPGSATGHSPGVGVGLSLVKRFAELHGGRAWVEERTGGGASFRVSIPSG